MPKATKERVSAATSKRTTSRHAPNAIASGSRTPASASTESRPTMSPSTTVQSTKLEPADVPTLKEFAKLPMTFTRVQVFGADGNMTVYQIKEDVYVAHADAEVDENGDFDDADLWRARIRSIHCTTQDNPSDVWLSVAWFWAPHDFLKLRPNYMGRYCGGNEMIFVPDFVDVVHSTSLNGHAVIHKYDESRIDLRSQIPEDDTYYRTIYNQGKTSSNKTKKPTGTFKMKPLVTCICARQYVPDEDGVMSLCPRKGCLKWYHNACLTNRKCLHKPDSSDALENEWGQTLDMTNASFFEEELDVCVLQANARLDDPGEEALATVLSLARRPCNRGGSYGLVGNAGFVLRARYLADLVLAGEPMPAEWKRFIWGKEVEWEMPAFEHMRIPDGARGATCLASFICPRCSKPI